MSKAKTQFSAAFEKWRDSAAGRRVICNGTHKGEARKYAVNRAWWAFTAGYLAAKKDAQVSEVGDE
jgi:hypothetical protein